MKLITDFCTLYAIFVEVTTNESLPRYIINISLLLFYDQSAFDVYSLHVFMYIHDVC